MRIRSKIIGLVALSLLALLPFLGAEDPKSNVVRIYKSGSGMCSGEQVQAPSGTTYILTAGHCNILIEDGQVNVETEDRKQLKRRVIAEDPASDLMLIEGLPGVAGFPIAEYNRAGDWVKTITHGNNFNTYQTEGTIIQDLLIEVPFFYIEKEEDLKRCSGEKFRVEEFLFGSVCVFKAYETISTALVVPGSSGGAVLNGDNELVGVVSCGFGPFSGFVTLSDIRKFLKNY